MARSRLGPGRGSMSGGLRLPRHDERGGPGRLLARVTFPGTGDATVRMEGDIQVVDVSVFLGIEVGAAIEDEDQVVGFGVARSSFSLGWFPAAQ